MLLHAKIKKAINIDFRDILSLFIKYNIYHLSFNMLFILNKATTKFVLLNMYTTQKHKVSIVTFGWFHVKSPRNHDRFILGFLPEKSKVLVILEK